MVAVSSVQHSQPDLLLIARYALRRGDAPRHELFSTLRAHQARPYLQKQPPILTEINISMDMTVAGGICSLTCYHIAYTKQKKREPQVDFLCYVLLHTIPYYRNTRSTQHVLCRAVPQQYHTAQGFLTGPSPETLLVSCLGVELVARCANEGA